MCNIIYIYNHIYINIINLIYVYLYHPGVQKKCRFPKLQYFLPFERKQVVLLKNMHFWWFPEFCAVLIAPICAVSLSEKCLKAVFPAVWFQNHVFSKTVEKMQQDDDTGMYTYVMDVSQVIGVTSESSSSHGLVRPRSSSLTTCLGRRLPRSWFQRCQKLLIYL